MPSYCKHFEPNTDCIKCYKHLYCDHMNKKKSCKTCKLIMKNQMSNGMGIVNFLFKKRITN